LIFKADLIFYWIIRLSGITEQVEMGNLEEKQT